MTDSPSVEVMEADLARTRAELADTVDRLSSRLDVQTRTTAKVGGAVAVIGAAVALVVWRRRSSTPR